MPLCIAVELSPDVLSGSSSVVPDSIPIRFLVSDVVKWLPLFNVFLSTEIAPDLSRLSQRLDTILRELLTDGSLHWINIISSKIILSREDLLEHVSSVPTESVDLLPPTDHWSFVLSPGSKLISVAAATSKDIRCLWHPDLPMIMTPTSPPLIVPLIRLLHHGGVYYMKVLASKQSCISGILLSVPLPCVPSVVYYQKMLTILLSVVR